MSNLVSHLKTKFDEGRVSCVGPYHSALFALGKIDLCKAKGARLHSQTEWIEDGKVSSSFFFRLEKKNQADHWVAVLKDAHGSIRSDMDSIICILSDFYSSPFSADETLPSAQDFLLSNLERSLDPEQALFCDGPLTVAKCRAALFGMARRKSPGCDGFPAEFYMKFWDILGDDLVDVLNFCFSSGYLTRTQHRGVISLSFKKGDRLDPHNWCPISLLNVDYKVALRAIAGQLLKVIHLVGPDQSCGVPGRYIGDSVASLRDVVSFASPSGYPVPDLSLNQEKAFDRVDWGFLRSTLVKMGFGPSIGWVDLFYSGVQTAVKVNSYLSPFFGRSCGVQQGCPLSPLLYVLYVW